MAPPGYAFLYQVSEALGQLLDFPANRPFFALGFGPELPRSGEGLLELAGRDGPVGHWFDLFMRRRAR